MKIKRNLLVGLLTFGVGTGSAAWGQSYSFRSIDVPGAASTISFGNNNDGRIVGQYTLGPCCLPAHAYELSQGSFRPIAFPGATTTIAYGINNKREVVGIYSTTGGNHGGFSLKGTTYASINYPGAISTFPSGINDQGTIAGGYFDGARFHGFLLENSNYKSFDFPGAVGTFWETKANHGFVLVGINNYTTLDFPGATGTILNEINDNGQIVGQYTGPYGSLDYHGFLAAPVSSAQASISSQVGVGIKGSGPRR